MSATIKQQKLNRVIKKQKTKCAVSIVIGSQNPVAVLARPFNSPN